MSTEPRRILVVANETVAGSDLIEAVKKRAADGEGPVHVHVVCPQNTPRHGGIIYDDETRAAADNRLTMTLKLLEEAGIDADGEVLDPDPYSAAMDALADKAYEEIIVSTHPETRSGWLRQGLPDRLASATGLPVEHIVVDVDSEEESDDVKHTLVVANQTVASEELVETLKKKAEEEPTRFIVICPQSGGEDGGGDDAHARLAETLSSLEEAGLDAIGQVVHPDPFTAIQNAVRSYGVDEVVISTFPETRSGWLRGDLIDRVRQSVSPRPVDHVVSEG
jgi:nucleotide-binding universal stress UspA family protein